MSNYLRSIQKLWRPKDHWVLLTCMQDNCSVGWLAGLVRLPPTCLDKKTCPLHSPRSLESSGNPLCTTYVGGDRFHEGSEWGSHAHLYYLHSPGLSLCHMPAATVEKGLHKWENNKSYLCMYVCDNIDGLILFLMVQNRRSSKVTQIQANNLALCPSLLPRLDRRADEFVARPSMCGPVGGAGLLHSVFQQGIHQKVVVLKQLCMSCCHQHCGYI